MIEEALNRAMGSTNPEKTFIDKLLARHEVEAIRDIIKKKKLYREDIVEILYLLSGTESKLLNYSEWDRYVILKFFVWIREFCKVYELLYDYKDDLEAKQKQGIVSLTPRTIKLLENNERLIEHNLKFLVDLYLNIGRSSLSVKAVGLMEFLKNKFEVSYPQHLMQQQQSQNNGLINSFRGKQ